MKNKSPDHVFVKGGYIVFDGYIFGQFFGPADVEEIPFEFFATDINSIYHHFTGKPGLVDLPDFPG